MKKFLALALSMSLVLTACGAQKTQPDTAPPAPAVTTAPVVTPTPAPTPTSTPEPTPTSRPTPKPTPVPTPSPMPVPVPTVPPRSTSPEAIASNGLSNEPLSWYYMKNSDHQTPGVQHAVDIDKYDAYYVGDTSEKVVYLTFDEGYENGYTGEILDILKEKNVQAAFFLTESYIERNIPLVTRMIEEGHTPGNHSVTHPSLPTLSDDEVRSEILDNERYFKETTGYDIAPFFRPPNGEYSERTLAITQSLGYKTIFWSFAHRDWLVDDQPPVDETYQMVMDGLHNGEIILLHAVSESNTKALPDIIDSIRAQGYRFATLDEL